MDRLQGKVLLLTGGGGVLGRASAELFAREGARVVVVDMLHDKAEETAYRINASDAEAIALAVDVTDEAAVRAAVETTTGHWGHLDTLFNNAGVMPRQDGSVLATPRTLYAVCDFDLHAPLAQLEPDYFHLQYRTMQDAVIVGSTGLSHGHGWHTLKNCQMLMISRATLGVTIVDITQSKRSPMEEQYLLQLQR